MIDKKLPQTQCPSCHTINGIKELTGTTQVKHKHTQHNRFTALLEFVWDNPDEQVLER